MESVQEIASEYEQKYAEEIVPIVNENMLFVGGEHFRQYYRGQTLRQEDEKQVAMRYEIMTLFQYRFHAMFENSADPSRVYGELYGF